MTLYLGVDIGTSSSKGVLVDEAGNVVATAVRTHEVDRPHVGWVEMSGDLWWDEFCSISRELCAAAPGAVAAVGVSGMGPCVLLTDDLDRPVRPAILYGVDTRATEQIDDLTRRLGAAAILERGGSALSTQAVGPKLSWVAKHEPEVFATARRLFMPASWLARRLTGTYVLDHHSASQSTPLYDARATTWHGQWAAPLLGGIELPSLVWGDEVVGEVTSTAARQSSLPAGIPVVSGSIDAWTEAVSVGAHSRGDLMLMYGTTMFMVATTVDQLLVPELWSTQGVFPERRCLAGGMATSGAVTGWIRQLTGDADFEVLTHEAAESGVGAHGLLMLPYFAGERTPIADPMARGVIAGLTLDHARGDLYRAALEATAFGVRHNIEFFGSAGAQIDRVVAVGGGTRGGLWAQVVSDVCGRPQELTRVTIGACYGAAFLAARSLVEVEIDQWNPVVATVEPRRGNASRYDHLYGLYRELYPATREVVHRLARLGMR